MEIITSFWNLAPITLVQSLMYAAVAIGIMIPFRILSLPDMSCEGSFPLGGCLIAATVSAGLNPFLATTLAIACGAVAGALTAYLHLRLRIHSLLAGILVSTMLWSVNLRVMGKPNSPMTEGANVFDHVSEAILQSNAWQIGVLAVITIAVVLGLVAFFHSEVGLSLRCVGANDKLAPALGIRSRNYIIGGFALANAIVAGGGALIAQQQGYADVTMGFGIVVNGLASLILGEALIGRHTVGRQMAAPLVGSLAYYQLVSLALATGLNPSDLKLLTGVFVIVALALPAATRRGGTRAA